MKNFVVKFGGFIINVMALITAAGLIVSSIRVFASQGLWAALGVMFTGLVSFMFVYFLIYLVMSINDKLSDMNNQRY